jgi:uncharacterized protein YuzE
MKLIYDRQTDTLTVILRDTSVAESDELRDGIILDYDREGHIVSFEILDASEYITEPVSIAYELKGVSR